MKVSLIVLTYNAPDFLDLVIRSVAEQTQLPDEIIVTDDGSTNETKELVDRLSQELSLTVRFLWQKDDGFRASRARNKAAEVAKGDYLIFIDGDCVLPRYFIQSHMVLSEQGMFVTGNRVLLTKKGTEKTLQKKMSLPKLSFLAWGMWRVLGYVNRISPLLLRIKSFPRNRKANKWEGAKSCNLSLHKLDFAAVNGFDEAFQGWGHEDADLSARLIGNGCLRKDGRYFSPVIHLWHQENNRDLEEDNIERLHAVLSGNRPVYAKHGMIKN